METIEMNQTDGNTPQEVRATVHLHQTRSLLVKVNEFLNTARHTIQWVVYILILAYLIVHMVRDGGPGQSAEVMTRLIYKMADMPAGFQLIDHGGVRLPPVPINGNTTTTPLPQSQ